MRRAWLFPGHGAQAPGMSEGADPGLLDLAQALAGKPLREIGLRGPAAALRDPLVVEPLLTAVQLSRLRTLGVGPDDLVAGYSAGETAALSAAGVLSERDALRAAVIRGQVLSLCADGDSRMVAVYGIPAAAAAKVVRGAFPEGEIEIAGWNGPEHLTIVGRSRDVARAGALVRRAGAALADIDVAGPWHSRRARNAAREIHRRLQSVTFHRPVRPIYLCASGRLEDDPERIRDLYARGVAAPTRFGRILRHLASSGAEVLVDVGPGRVLYALALLAPAPEAIAVRSADRDARGAPPRSAGMGVTT